MAGSESRPTGLLSYFKRAGDDVQFANIILRDYRDVRKVHHYEYTAEDKAVLQACGKDLRPLAYSLLPPGVVWWLSGRLAARGKAQRSLGMRGTVAFLRLLASAEVFRVGYLVGSHRQSQDCMRGLVGLRTPLGGEVAALIRQRDPQSPILKHERPPAELAEDGSRPRIATEANRLAQLARLHQQLEHAKSGVGRVDRGNEQHDEQLGRVAAMQGELVDGIVNGGGPLAVAATGRLESFVPGEEGGAGGNGPTHVRVMRGAEGGLVIVEDGVEDSQRHGPGGSSGGGGRSAGGGGGSAGTAAAGDDPLGWLTGSRGGGSGGSDGDGEGQASSSRRERRRERRRRRHYSGDDDE